MSTETIDLPLGRDADCEPCAGRIRDTLAHHDGVTDIKGVRDDTALRVTVDAEHCDAACLTNALEEARRSLHSRYSHPEMTVTGMDCADCASRIEHTVRRLPGIDGVSVSVTSARLRLELDTEVGDLNAVRGRVTKLGYGVANAPAAPSAAGLTELPQATASEDSRHAPDRDTHDSEPHGHSHDAAPHAHDVAPTAALDAPLPAPTGIRAVLREWTRGSDRVTRIAAALLFIAVLLDLTRFPGIFAIVAYAASTAAGGVSIARSGINGAIATRRPDMNLLMAIAVLGAVAIGAWMEAALVVVLFSIGELLEGRAVGRARRELEALVSLTPAEAVVRRTHMHGDIAHHEELTVPVDALIVGDVVIVRPGQQIPADGTILEGASAIDQAAITGESTPVDRAVGEQVFAGTLNGEGLLAITTTSAPGDTTLDRIARLVADAQARRSPSERWVQAFARIYTPIVIAVALLVTIVPPALGLMDFSDAFYSALALLILACPCALVLSTPVSIVSALGRASAAGVLVKGGAHLERAATIQTVAFDKTGTLTAGEPEVVQIDGVAPDGSPYPLDLTPPPLRTSVLATAAALEQGSAHPLAAAIVAAAKARHVDIPSATDLRSLTGLGASGTIDGDACRVGSPRLLATAEQSPVARDLAERLSEAGRTVVLVERAGQVIGAIGLADRPRPEAREAIAKLSELGITRTVMLTGDNPRTAAAIAEDLGIAEVAADLMPGDKADAVRQFGDGVAMIGDGVNDTPALAAADLGIAMGTAGSPAAIEVADVALMGDDPRKIAELIGLARWTRTVVRQNIAFSLGTKVIAAVFLLFGALPLWAAVGVDVGASLLVVANGLRLVSRHPAGKQALPILERRPLSAPTVFV